MKSPTINQQEAGAFCTHCALRGLSAAEALAELAQTTWPDTRADAAFGRRRHTPTIRRLAKPMLLRLDAQYAVASARREAEAADRARWASLPAAVQAEILRGLLSARTRKHTRRVRDLASAHGITIYAETIDRLTEMVIGRGFGHLRYVEAMARDGRGV